MLMDRRDGVHYRQLHLDPGEDLGDVVWQVTRHGTTVYHALNSAQSQGINNHYAPF